MLKFHFKFPCLDGLIQTRVLTNQSTRYIGYMLFYNCMQWRSQNDNWGGGIFIYSRSALLISFEINCFYGM